MSRADVARDHFADQFDHFESAVGNSAPDWLAPIRRAAIERFAELGLPTRRDEAWKYTGTTRITEARLRPLAAANGVLTKGAVEERFGSGSRLVFENGQWAPALSSDALPEGVVATGLSQLIADDPEAARTLIAQSPEAISRPFSALNLAFGSDGAVVRIAGSADRPLELIFVSTADAAGHFANPRNWIQLEPGARATVVVHYASHGDSGDTWLTNAVTSVALGANAELDLITVQQESDSAIHLGSIDVEQQRDSCLRSHLISLGCQIARNEINSRLNEPGAECTLNGLFLASERQHVDNQTLIEHGAPHGTSRQLYKGICGGRAQGVFNGTIRVQPHAQKTDAQQSNPNLLTSERAQINTKPTLEIYADDVKCAHGSTIGRLDDNALFYLRSRGIALRDAEHILTGAFASEICNAIPDAALRERVDAWIAARLQRAIAESA